jgi:L-asparagine transporter-like permease
MVQWSYHLHGGFHHPPGSCDPKRDAMKKWMKWWFVSLLSLLMSLAGAILAVYFIYHDVGRWVQVFIFSVALYGIHKISSRQFRENFAEEENIDLDKL